MSEDPERDSRQGAGGEGAAAVPARAPGPTTGFALIPVLAIAAAVTAVLAGYAGRYGYHRDELYFVACGERLAWGYPDQPPFVPLIARLTSETAANSLVLLRIPSAIAAGALVALVALITRELGGGKAAQALAAAITALAPITTGAGHIVSTAGFDLPIWALLTWLFLRLLRGGDQRLWLIAGVITGAGLLDTDLVAFQTLAVLAGLAVTGPRRHFRSAWFYSGAAIAAAMWAPYLVWQADRGWPELAVAHSIAAGNSGTSAPWWLIVPEQLILLPLWFAPVWIAGLIRLWRAPELRWCRSLAVAWPVLAVVYMATGGKPYYLTVLFGVPLGAGAQPTIDWIRRARRGWTRRGLITAGMVLALAGLPDTLPIVPVADVGSQPLIVAEAGETIGWPAYVGEIAGVYRSIPAAQRSSTVILASNYGEAGAVGRFGTAVGLPAAYSGQDSYWYWGPPPATATTAVTVGYPRSQLGFCGSLRYGTTLSNHLGVNDQEQGDPVWVCSRLRRSWRAIWPSQRYLG